MIFVTKLVGHTEEVKSILATGKRVKKLKEVRGMFNELVAELYQIKTEDGQLWNEFVQIAPWKDRVGPYVFLAVRNNKTDKVIGWSEEEIEQTIRLIDNGEFVLEDECVPLEEECSV